MSTTDERGRVHLTYDEAIARLPDKPRIHTFIDAGRALLGADWDREDVLEAIRQYGAQETGKIAQSMGHGLAVWRDAGDEDDVVFIEADGPPASRPAPDSSIAGLGVGVPGARRTPPEAPSAAHAAPDAHAHNHGRSARQRSSPPRAVAGPSDPATG